MTMATFSSMEMGGASMPEMQVPVMKIGLDLNVASVSPSGDISYAVAFSDMSVENAPGVNPAVLAAMQGLDSDIKTVTGTGTISDRGFVRSQAFDFSRLSNPVLKQTMDSLSAAMQNMSAPLPEEAVGVGARWEVRQSLAIGGLQTLQRVIFELVGLDAKTVTLKTRIETTAPPQVIRTPALPEWADVRLQQCTGSGTGKVTMRLDSLVPTSEATVQQDALMEISIGGTARTMRSATTMKVGISSVKQADPGTSAPEQKA